MDQDHVHTVKVISTQEVTMVINTQVVAMVISIQEVGMPGLQMTTFLPYLLADLWLLQRKLRY